MKLKLNFFERAQIIAQKIPYGRVTSYGAIARYLGSAKSARTVGWAMKASSGDETVPAHRVVNSKGILTGKHHFQGTNLMQQLLESEGIIIKNFQIQNFDEVFWDPVLEL
jgi:methylated-DNA-protein-cysteine methyltransferase-like protein